MRDGLVNVLKPSGMTSHDVVSFLRRIYGQKRIGHAGTLDPDASGVLPLLLGQATRLLEYGETVNKTYRAELLLGVKTTTGDDSGEIVQREAVKFPSEALIAATLDQFIGKLEQIPPMYSAIKQDGKKLYDLARRGLAVERKPRTVHIFSAGLLAVQPERKTLLLEIECSKGTYIRTFCEDFAAALGNCGTMSFLLRTKVGDLTISAAHTPEEIMADPEACLLPPEELVKHLPVLSLSERQALRVSQGVVTTLAGAEDGIYRLYNAANHFFGIGCISEEKIKPEKILFQQ